jgi:hypothetical protein
MSSTTCQELIQLLRRGAISRSTKWRSEVDSVLRLDEKIKNREYTGGRYD